jgi:DnaK suppressor protein
MEITSDQITSLKERILTIKEENLNYQKNFSKELGGDKMGDMVDMANSDMNLKRETIFRARYVEKERELNRALEKINEGEYGMCEECEGPIAHRRLELNPTALRCVVCQEKLELN